MVKVWQRLETVVLLIIAISVLLGSLTSLQATLFPAILVLLAVMGVARLNGHRKRYQLLAWEDAYAEWAALRTYDPAHPDRHHDLFADAREVFAIDADAMRHRWWEADIAAYVRDTRTWNAVLDWMRRTSLRADPTH